MTEEVLTVTFDCTISCVERRSPRTEAEAEAALPYLTRGLVDLQVNGYAGIDVNQLDQTVEDLEEITLSMVACGVTSWVPTLLGAPEDALMPRLSAIGSALRKSRRLRDAIPFVHVEGPFISDADGARGVHDTRYIRPLDSKEVGRWVQAGPVGMITVSPHWAGSPDHIARIVRQGVRVAIGHTHASHTQIADAVDAGATVSTHLGNGIAERIPRHPNPIWSQLAEPRLACGLIADGHHLPPETLSAMVRAKGASRAFLVSDATALAGMPQGDYETAVGGRVRVGDDRRLTSLSSGTLAGSASNLAQGLQYAVVSAGISPREAVPLATSTPARLAGLPPSLAVGAAADMVVVDRDGSVIDVWKSGIREAGGARGGQLPTARA